MAQTKKKEEIHAAKVAWRAHFDLLSDIDELNQCKGTMRLRLEGEDVSALTENEAAFIIDPANIAVEMMEHEAKQATALAELRRVQDSLRYLKTQRQERNATTKINSQGNKANASEVCSVCLATFDNERSVLPCGHSFHSSCLGDIFKRSGGTTARCPLRCQNVIRREDVLIASDKSKNDGSQSSVKLFGDWGTKVNRLVGDVINVVQVRDKGIIFSQWEEMLDIVAEALMANQVSFVRPRSGKRFGEDVKKFRSNGCPVLLMNVRNGAVFRPGLKWPMVDFAFQERFSSASQARISMAKLGYHRVILNPHN